MPEEKEWFERRQSKEAGASTEFIASSMKDVSEAMSRYSVTPSPEAIFDIEGLTSDVDNVLAEALSKVEIDDPELKNVSVDTEEGFAKAAELTAAKANSVAKETRSEKTKTRLQSFADRVITEASNTLSQYQLGKKALRLAPVAGLILGACGPVESATLDVNTATPEPTTSETISIPTDEPTVTPESTPTEIPDLKLEDGTQMERMEQGEFNDLFPGSEVYMSERGDLVIVNKETGLELAGQKVETEYGSFTLLISRSHFQFLYKEHFGEETELGGYPNFADSHLREEISRIISTLIQLKEKEISVGSVNLATYEPAPKDFVAIFANPGSTYQIADSLQEGLVNPEEAQTLVNAVVGFPVMDVRDGRYLFIRMANGAGSRVDWIEPNVSLEKFLGTLNLSIFGQLVSEASTSQGTGEIPLFGPYDLVSKSVYAQLFSNPEVKITYGGMLSLVNHEPPFSPEEISKYFELDLGANGVVSVDFDKFE